MENITTENKKLVISELDRYDIKKEAKILKALSSIFEEQTKLVSEEDIVNSDEVHVTDLSQVCICTAKTTRGKIILRRFYDPEKCQKVPVFDFKNSDGTQQPGHSLYSTDYFLNIIKVLNEVDEHFEIKLGKDTPCIIETEDFRFLLAPRIESE